MLPAWPIIIGYSQGLDLLNFVSLFLTIKTSLVEYLVNNPTLALVSNYNLIEF